MDDGAGCGLFGLPPELRSLVYTLIYIHESGDFSLDKAAATAPTRVPLLTCRQIYAEAWPLYRLAARAYWVNMTFQVDVAEVNDHYTPAELSQAATDIHLNHVTRDRTGGSRLSGREQHFWDRMTEVGRFLQNENQKLRRQCGRRQLERVLEGCYTLCRAVSRS